MVVSVFLLHYSHFVAQHRYIKNQPMQSHFLMLSPCDCITKIKNNFMKGLKFKNQITRFGGIGSSFFSVIEKKRDEQCWSKVGDGAVGV